MTAFSDAMMTALGNQGYTGTANERLLQLLLDSGATSTNINDAWMEVFSAQGATETQFNSAWGEVLTAMGYTGTLTEKEYQFWLDGGSFAFTLKFAENASATPVGGTGTYTYSRLVASETITDFEGLVKTTLVDEIGFDGQRRVENKSQGLPAYGGTLVDITDGITDPAGGTSAYRASAQTAGTMRFFIGGTNYPNCPVGTDVIYSASLKIPSTNKSDAEYFVSATELGGSDIQFTPPVFDKWFRITAGAVAVTFVDDTMTEGISMTTHNQSDYIDIAFPQMEVIEGHIDNTDAPSEYVSVGVGTGPEALGGEWDFVTGDDPPAGITKGGAGSAYDFSGNTCLYTNSLADNANLSDDTFVPVIGQLYAYSVNILQNDSGMDQFRIWLGDDFVDLETLGTGIKTGTVRCSGVTTSSAGIQTSGSFGGGEVIEYDDFSIKEIDHGCNVDGVKYFPYKNGNTVTSNVVDSSAHPGDTIDTTTPVNLGVNSWESRINYCTYSEDFSDASWVSGGGGVAKSSDGVTLPDGTTGSAETLTASGANGTLLNSITLAAAANTFSIYLQRKTGTGNIDITLDNGVTWTTKALTGVGTWDRVDIQGASAANPIVGIRIVTSGDAVQAWGAQLETGAFVTPYIPNLATGTTTRNVDNLQYDSDNYEDAGWVLLDIMITQDQIDNAATVPIALVISDASASQYLAVYIAGSNLIVASKGVGSLQQGTHPLATGRSKVAISWDRKVPASSVIKSSHNGSAASVITTLDTQIAAADQIVNFDIGYNSVAAANFWNGNVLKVESGTSLLTDDQLEAKATL